MRVLAGDVGGTNSRIAVLETDGYQILAEEVYPSDRHDGLGSVIARFNSDVNTPFDAACFGLAGPVEDGRVKTTNLPWVVDERDLADELGVPVAVINDLEAAAWSLDVLADDEVDLIYPGIYPEGAEGQDVPTSGNRALIAAGTGLGQAGLFWDGDRHRPFATEGGHADFAPSDDLEWELRAHLAERHGRVSWERVVSGPGLVAIHHFLCSRRGDGAGCPVEELPEGDDSAGPAITRRAREGTCEVCSETLDRFCRLLGAETGNLALKMLATGGVWVGGGIAPAIVEELREGLFVESFLSKGRMRHVLEPVPVRVILFEKTALRGAARFAARLAAGEAGRAGHRPGRKEQPA